MINIYMFWSTIRPDTFKDTYAEWMHNCVHPGNCRSKVVVDRQEDADKLDGFDVMVVDNPTKGIVYPLNKLHADFKAERRDIIIVPSDDFYPPTNWDQYVREQLTDMDGVLQVNDGNMKDIVSIPVMTYSAFERMNRVIYHPAYTHMFADKELFDTAMELDMLKRVDPGDPLFEHKHYFFHTRDMDEHDEVLTAEYPIGKKIYAKRRYMDFQERLNV